MKNPPLLIRQIKQKDNYTFSIIWNDGKEQCFRLSTLQRLCPCAQCCDEQTGQRLNNPVGIKDDVRAFHIRNVGRYALKIYFTSGCSTGIYSFDFLRRLSEGSL